MLNRNQNPLEILMDMQTITLTVELQPHEAEALAQFLKRVGFNEFRLNATNDGDAYIMMNAAIRIQKALAEQGFNPR